MARFTLAEYRAHLARQKAAGLNTILNDGLEPWPCAANHAAGRFEQSNDEGELRTAIIEECKCRRWYVVSSRTDKRTTQAEGVPDLIIAAQGVTYWVELKRKGGKLSEAQNIARHVLGALGHRYSVIYSLQEFMEFVR